MIPIVSMGFYNNIYKTVMCCKFLCKIYILTTYFCIHLNDRLYLKQNTTMETLWNVSTDVGL